MRCLVTGATGFIGANLVRRLVTLGEQVHVILRPGSSRWRIEDCCDAVEAYLLLAEKMDDNGIHGEAFNFSNEIQLTVLEITQKILRLMNREDLQPKILNEVKGEIKHQYLSAQKAREVLGWKPRYTLDQGLAETINWYKEYLLRLEEDR